MQLLVKRDADDTESVPGALYVDSQWECWTLEPSRTNPVHEGHPCIPAGTYKAILTPSPHLGYVCPEILDVPGRSDIRLHIGNWAKDSLGCTLVGMNHGKDFVGESRMAFSRLMILLRGASEITITYQDPE